MEVIKKKFIHVNVEVSLEKIRMQRPSELQTIHIDFNLEEVNIRFDKGNLVI